MTPRRRHRTALLVAALAGLGGGLAGCGSAGLLPGDDASRLEASLDQAETAYDEGRCQDAAAAVREARERVSGLPASTDDELVRTLERGFRNLRSRVESTCEETPTTTEAAPTTTDEIPTTTETIPPPTTEEAPTTTDEVPTTTDEAPAPSPSDGEDGPPLDDDGADQGPSGGGPDVPGAAGRAGREARRAGRRALREARGRVRDAARGPGRERGPR